MKQQEAFKFKHKFLISLQIAEWSDNKIFDTKMQEPGNLEVLQMLVGWKCSDEQ